MLPFRHYTYDEFKRKVLKMFEEADFSQLTSQDMKQGNEETPDDLLTGLQFNEMKSFPKLDLLN